MSNYTIQRETVLTLEYDSVFYTLDAVGTYSYSQTYARSSNVRKTLHRKNSMPLSLIPAKNPGSASLEINSTDSFIESVLFQLLGFYEKGGVWYTQPSIEVQPEYFNLYITDSNTTTMLHKCALSSLDIPLSKGTSLVFAMGLEFSNIIPDVEEPVGGLPQGNMHVGFQALTASFGDYGMPPASGDVMEGLNNATFSIQQQFSWRSDNSIHTINEIHIPSVAILEELPINAVVSTFARNDQIIPDELYYAGLILQLGNILKITITGVTMTKRREVSDVLNLQYDLSLQESSEVAVEYGAIQ